MAQAGNISLFSVVDQPVGSVFHPTLCTKARTCGRPGQRVDQLGTVHRVGVRMDGATPLP